MWRKIRPSARNRGACGGSAIRRAPEKSANREIERPCEQFSLSRLLAVDFGLPTDQGLAALASERLSLMFRNPSLRFPKVSDSDQAGSKGQAS
jgi:hypothetical protein